MCRRCAADPPPFRQARACFAYSTASAHGFARAVVLRWKYGHDLVLGSALARHLARCSPLARVCYDAIVPVPSHPARLARRGFNQAALLARSVARSRRMPVAFALGRRVRGPSQTSLGREERQANTAGSFFVRDERAVRRRRVLLVDDVLTTTATTRACAEALLAAGAAVVDVAALARTTDAPLRGAPGRAASDPSAGRRG
jgi:ComF family protein